MIALRAQSAVVAFDNPFGPFVWTGATGLPAGMLFDPTLPASEQHNANIAHAMAYSAPRQAGGSGTPIGNGFNSSPGLRIIRDTTTFQYTSPAGIPINVFPATVLPEGAIVGPGANFQQAAATAINGMFLNEPIRLLGQSPTVGFRVTLADGFHYGLIEFDWRISPADDGGFVGMYQPVRWAYETTPNMPIGVPSPSAVALLILAGGVAFRRRR